MKHRLILLTAAVAVATLHAETTVWKLDRDDDFYIAGSCHALKASDYPLPPEFEDAYNNSEQIVFETDLRELMLPTTQRRLMEMGQYPEGETIEDHLSPEAYAELVEYCETHSLPLDNLKQFKPFFLTMSLMVVEMQKIGVGFQDGLDVYFLTKAKGDGKAIEGLETTDEHLNLMSAFDGPVSDALIEKTLDEMEELGPMMERLLAAWRAGDTEEIDVIFSEEMREEYPELYAQLIVDRNKNWVAPIEKLIKSGTPTMIVVGCGHLAGKDSVIELLRAKGHTLTKHSVAESPAQAKAERAASDQPSEPVEKDAPAADDAPAVESKKVILEKL